MLADKDTCCAHAFDELGHFSPPKPRNMSTYFLWMIFWRFVRGGLFADQTDPQVGQYWTRDQMRRNQDADIGQTRVFFSEKESHSYTSVSNWATKRPTSPAGRRGGDPDSVPSLRWSSLDFQECGTESTFSLRLLICVPPEEARRTAPLQYPRLPLPPGLWDSDVHQLSTQGQSGHKGPRLPEQGLLLPRPLLQLTPGRRQCGGLCVL